MKNTGVHSSRLDILQRELKCLVGGEAHGEK